MTPAPAPIPRILHAIWWQGWEALPAPLRALMAHWQLVLPGWELVFWDQPRLLALVAAMPTPQRQLWQAGWQRARRDIQRIDLSKWAVLWAHGGLFSDLDMVLLRDPSPLWAQRSFYICCETLAPSVPCNAFIAASPQLRLVEALAAGQVAALGRAVHPDPFLDTMNTTGPQQLARIVAQLAPLPTEAVVDLRVEHVYPVPWQRRAQSAGRSVAQLLADHPSAYAVHLWAGLWK